MTQTESRPRNQCVWCLEFHDTNLLLCPPCEAKGQEMNRQHKQKYGG
jgi:hypothetical protein